jgi:hypothetical protein
MGRPGEDEIVLREGEHGEAPPAADGVDVRVQEVRLRLWKTPEPVVWHPEDANAVLRASDPARENRARPLLGRRRQRRYVDRGPALSEPAIARGSPDSRRARVRNDLCREPRAPGGLQHVRCLGGRRFAIARKLGLHWGAANRSHPPGYEPAAWEIEYDHALRTVRAARPASPHRRPSRRFRAAPLVMDDLGTLGTYEAPGGRVSPCR